MKTQKARKKTKDDSMNPDQIQQIYKAFLLEHENRPSSVFKFCKSNGIEEDKFYQFYGSFKALDKAIWKAYAQTTIERLHQDENYAMFTSREKVLAFYFTLAEELKRDRSYVLLMTKKWRHRVSDPSFTNKFRQIFNDWAQAVIDEGKANGEIAMRPLLDRQYGPLLWFHLKFVLQFWAQDDSADFEKTDEVIEKSVNLAFDLMGKGVVDNAFEFGKFLFQQRRD